MRKDIHIRQALATIIDAAGNNRWVLGGSSGLLLRGLQLPTEPNDIDLYCDDKDMLSIHRALQQFAIDDPELSESDIYRSTLSHYQIGQYRVELVGGFQISAHGCRYKTEVKNVLRHYSKAVDVGVNGLHQLVHIVPLAHELWFNALRDRSDRVELIVDAIRLSRIEHKKALTVIEQKNGFPKELIECVNGWINDQREGELEWTLKLSSGLPVVQ
ncbi:hypothetical protein I6N90_09145 [Paenibacillus sp. GSMTC-2017]|uniref:hypothetical protein n=1 Tax=Paenibacillus sp. GSMTC-2017 TaxID=2794350 RepID=UPI0018D67F85|nr:hypothetical protein [Paenibacillus sp. GSMTC-2017]MBH5317969.1 hypothetical protein [Paenibacillus sp. GSMTC-2017]